VEPNIGFCGKPKSLTRSSSPPMRESIGCSHPYIIPDDFSMSKATTFLILPDPEERHDIGGRISALITSTINNKILKVEVLDSMMIALTLTGRSLNNPYQGPNWLITERRAWLKQGLNEG
jgi:hypothetical protein